METAIRRPRGRDVIVTPQNRFAETIRLKEENIMLQQKNIVEPEGYVVQAYNSPRSGKRKKQHMVPLQVLFSCPLA